MVTKARRSCRSRPGHAEHGFEDDLGPRGWGDEEFHTLLGRMRGPGGVPVVDRRHLFTVYRKCFVGREAVDWVVRTSGLTREEAVIAGHESRRAVTLPPHPFVEPLPRGIPERAPLLGRVEQVTDGLRQPLGRHVARIRDGVAGQSLGLR